MDLYSFLLFHTNKPRISNVIAKETCHISCIIAIHHTAQLFVSSVLKLCFSQECRTLTILSLCTEFLYTLWGHLGNEQELAGVTGRAHRVSQTSSPSCCSATAVARAAPALLPLTQFQAQKRDSTWSLVCLSKGCGALGWAFPRGRSSFIPWCSIVWRFFEKQNVPNPASKSAFKSHRVTATKGKAGKTRFCLLCGQK